jgi:hypothetical protein
MGLTWDRLLRGRMKSLSVLFRRYRVKTVNVAANDNEEISFDAMKIAA